MLPDPCFPQVSRWTTTLWDQWRPVLEIDYTASGDETARRYYTWGPDVSGSVDGAAGIGGLIEILEIKGNTTTRSLPIYDGIGNVVGLVDGTSGARVATYSYGPFGELLAEYGSRADSCPFRFQTKLYDEETGYYYFGKRYYDPKTQTWISRDPAREDGGVNLYAYCNDDPVGNFDPIGEAVGPAIPGSNPQQNAYDALLFFADFIHGPAHFGKSFLGLFDSTSDTDEYADNLETVTNGLTLGIPQMAAADGDPQKSAQIVQGMGRQFTTPEGWGNLTFAALMGFAGPKVGDFMDDPVVSRPDRFDMITKAPADGQIILHRDQVIMNNYQRYYNDAWEEVVNRFNAGKIPISEGQNWQMVLGQNVDLVARARLRNFLLGAQIPEGPGADVLVNRWLRDPSGSGAYRIPDVRLIQTGNILEGTIGNKPMNLQQIQDFISFSQGNNVIIVQPTVGPIFGNGGD